MAFRGQGEASSTQEALDLRAHVPHRPGGTAGCYNATARSASAPDPPQRDAGCGGMRPSARDRGHQLGHGPGAERAGELLPPRRPLAGEGARRLDFGSATGSLMKT